MNIEHYFEPTSKEYQSVAKLVEKFAFWRKNKSTMGRTIPKDLWIAAANLAIELSSIKKVVVILKLDYVKLKKLVISIKSEKPKQIVEETKQSIENQSDMSMVSSKLSSPFSDKNRNLKNKLNQDGQSDKIELSRSNDFIQAPLSCLLPISNDQQNQLPILAQVTSPHGFTLKLYSHNSIELVKAFIKL
jgi:hypothetical protein